MLFKNFACGGLSSLLYFNFVHDSIIICVRLWQMLLKKKFACGGLSSLLYFNFVQDFIIYLCTIVKMLLKNFLPAAGYHHSCISIPTRISAHIEESAVKVNWERIGTLFWNLLNSYQCIPAFQLESKRSRRAFQCLLNFFLNLCSTISHFHFNPW